jgi:hypothetical protein
MVKSIGRDDEEYLAGTSDLIAEFFSVGELLGAIGAFCKDGTFRISNAVVSVNKLVRQPAT